MTDAERIAKTAEYVKRTFEGEGTGHDWWHMYRVWQLSKHINKTEHADQAIVELGALLHDIADWKFHGGDTEAGPKAAREWLKSLDTPERVIAHVEDIIRHVSYKGAKVASDMKTLEGKIIHDADKLDAMGAIGIARAFAYGGANGRPMYDPSQKPKEYKDFESYKRENLHNNHTINHFYEKLLLLKDRMYTKTARRMANNRHKHMETYLKEFYAEWDGKL